MDQNPGTSTNNNCTNLLLNMSGYNFESFDDEVSKESNDLTVDANAFVQNDGHNFNSENNPQMISDISQVQLMGQGSVQRQGTTESSDVPEKKKGGWPKGKKRKRIRTKDVNAPRQPLTGYIRYLNDKREGVRAEHPSLPFSEITKMLAKEWTKLPLSDKQHYLDEAEKDKERYVREMEAYYKTEAYKIFQQKKLEKKRKNDMLDDDHNVNTSGVNGSLEILNETPQRDENEVGTFDIPIFTEEFMDHNKNREAELRQLRKQNTEYEEQNAILSKHIEQMKQAIEKLEVEAVQHRNNNMSLQQHLENLRSNLTTNFASVALPGTNETPRIETIDTYMAKLHTIILDNPQDNENLIATVREIIGRLNFDM